MDESNDRGNDKLLVILARVYDDETSRVETKFLDMPVCNSGTAENMFNAIDKVLRLVILYLIKFNNND